MTKRISEQLEKFSAKNKKIHFSFGTLVVMGLSVIALVVATFTLLKLPNADGLMLFFDNPSSFINQKLYLQYGIDYIPQIPILLFICVILGRKYSLIAICGYILLGLLLFPVFSFGGGIKYFLQYHFGYILAFIPAVWVATDFIKKERSFLNCLWAVLSAVSIIYLIGSVYLILIAMVKGNTFDFAMTLISYQMGFKMIYDIVLGYISMIIARPSRHILWFAMG